MKTQILVLPNKRYAPLTARYVRPGDPYGLDFCLNADKPMVEFYDARYPHTDFGQFVSRYNLDTFIAAHPDGINLYGGEPEWILTTHKYARTKAWLERITREEMVVTA